MKLIWAIILTTVLTGCVSPVIDAVHAKPVRVHIEPMAVGIDESLLTDFDVYANGTRAAVQADKQQLFHELMRTDLQYWGVNSTLYRPLYEKALMSVLPTNCKTTKAVPSPDYFVFQFSYACD